MSGEKKEKLDPEFRKLLLLLTMEYLAKSPEDFIDFSIDFLKKQQKIRTSKFASDDETTDSLISEMSFDNENSIYNQMRTNIFQEGVDLDETFSAEIIPKSIEKKKLLIREMQKILVFKELHEEDLDYLADVMGKQEVKKNDIIINEGDTGDFFYIIEEGTFTAYKSKDGEKVVLKTYKNEGYFGELALLYNMPRSCSVRSETGGVLWYLGRETFRRVVVSSSYERRQQYLDYLGKVPILAGLSTAERLDLADCLVPRFFSPGSRIIREGDSADGMYFLLSGTARVTVKGVALGSELEVKDMKAGDYFGELALITHKPRMASVHAVDNVQTAFLDVKSFERLLGPCIDIMKRNFSEYDEQMKYIVSHSKYRSYEK